MDPFGTPAPADIVAQMLNALSPKAMANREFKQNTVKRQNLSSSRCGWHCILFLTKMLSGKSFEEATGMKALSETAKAEKETENFEKRNMGQIGGSFVDKLLDSGHLPELHLWTPWSGKHNFTGPGTKIWERVDKVTRKPKKGSEPVNAVDAISLTHDLAYEDHKDPAKRKQADVDMINSLNGVIASGNWREKLDAHITKAAIRTKQMLGLGIEPWLRPGYKPKISTLSKEKISTS
jgi:hypothetical protein